MSKFTEKKEAYSEQIRSMRNEGKTYLEIRMFFKENYGIKLHDSVIARIMNKDKKTKKVGVGLKDLKKSLKKHPLFTGKVGSWKGLTIMPGECPFMAICKFFEICRPEICKFKGA